jgi:Tfp pilus assembly protein PilV
MGKSVDLALKAQGGSSDGLPVTPNAPRTESAPGQEGFVLIEVLISALIIAIVAGAVLALISATTRSAASQRTHAVAYGLAQEDQARLRSLRLASLNRLDTDLPPVKIDGTTYTVHSEGTFVSNSTGDVSCDGAASPADYVRITSTVRSTAMANPVAMQSIVSPSNGALDPNHGTLSVKATNALGQPLSGVSISGGGIGNFTGSTDSTGCANFADLPSGNYTVTTSAGGMINTKGETSTAKEIGVPSAGTQPLSLMYDRAGWIEPEFVYKSGSALVLATVDSMMVYSFESGTSAVAYGTPGGTRAATIKSPGIFPFKGKYTVYGGSCATNNPDPEEKVEANRVAMGFPLVPPNAIAKPRIQLPALNLTVSNNGLPISGARVTITDTNSACKYASAAIKRVYTTNAGGQQAASSTGVSEPALPWGKYKICASAKVKTNEWRRIESGGTPIAVENLTSGTTLPLSLSGAGSVSGATSTTACP